MTLTPTLTAAVPCMLALLSTLVASAQQAPPPTPGNKPIGSSKVYASRQGVEPYLGKTFLYREFQPLDGPVPGTVVFGITRGSPEPYDTWPVIFVLTQQGWQLVSLDTDFKRFTWSHVAIAPAKGYLWGFLEYTVEGPSADVPVLMSTDAGKTWRHVASVPKPDFLASFHSFSMAPNGQGTLQLRLAGAPSPGRRRFFTYVTRDWGKTWKRSGRPTVDVLEDGRAPLAPACGMEQPQPEACQLPDYLLEAVRP